ncbi:MAG: hypothetical protein ABJC12_02630 [Saprospiraceae bacterium]
MKKLLFLSLMAAIYACSNDLEPNIENTDKIGWRTLPKYTIPYQYPSGYVETEVSSNLTTWSTGATASQNTSKYGTTSSIYEINSRIITIYQNTSNQLRSVEYVDGPNQWTIPSVVSTATSPLLPTIENQDGTLYEAHASVPDITGQFVKGNTRTGYASNWSSTYNLKSGGGAGSNIPTNYSPSLEYHANSGGVLFLITAVINHSTNLGVPGVYWRYNTSNFTSTTAPTISLGTSDPTELNASICPIAVGDELWLFYTIPGSSSQSELVIKYVKATISGSGSGAISGSWSSPTSVSGAYTNHKIDGFYDSSSQKIVLVFQNYSTGYIDLAISGDFGSTWDLSVTGIASTNGAPSIAHL